MAMGWLVGHFNEKKAAPSDQLKIHGARWLEANAPSRRLPATANQARQPADTPTMPVPGKK